MILRVAVSGIVSSTSRRSGIGPWRRRSGRGTRRWPPGRRRVAGHGDAAAGALPQYRIRHRHDRRHVDLRMRGEQVFDVAGVVLDSAAIDDVLAPSGDGDVSLPGDDREIAGAEPAAGGEGVAVGLRVVEIPREQQRTPDLELASLAGRQHRIVRTDDPHLRARLGRPAVSATVSMGSPGRVYRPAWVSVIPQSWVTCPFAMRSCNPFATAGATALPERTASRRRDSPSAVNRPARGRRRRGRARRTGR